MVLMSVQPCTGGDLVSVTGVVKGKWVYSPRTLIKHDRPVKGGWRVPSSHDVGWSWCRPRWVAKV